MANKVEFGISNLYVGTYTVGSGGSVTMGTPYHQAGAVSFSPEEQSESNTFYADNVAYATFAANAGYEGTLEIALISDDFRKDILGEVVDSDIQIEKASSTTHPFALLFQFEGDDTATKHVIYKCSATRPSIAGQTTEEEIEPQTETLTITAGSIHNATVNKDIVKARCASGDDAYSGWFSAVWQPGSPSTTT